MPTALQLPFDLSDAQRVGKNLFRKQLLPLGSIEHKGENIEFTPERLQRMAENFAAGKRDQLPFVLVNEKNEHVDSPEKYQGEAKTVEVAGDGLYVTLELTDDGTALVEANPKLGVSARFDPATDELLHIAGTLDPSVKGMKPWEKVSLSDERDTVDLTEAEFAGVSAPSATSSSRTVTETATKSPEELLADMLAGNGSESETKPAELSESDRKAIELARSESESARREAREARDELAKERFERKRDALVAAGVPPADVNLAEPILKGGSDTIELSNGEKADAHSIVTKLLESRMGTVPLTELSAGGGEEGSEQAQAKEMAEKWAKASSGVSE